MEQTNDTNPDDLMRHFRGRSLKSIIIFTIVIHAVVILGSSVPYLLKTFTGADTENLSQDERIEIAVKEATASLQRIAQEHGVQAQDLSENLNSGRKPTAKPDAEPDAAAPAADPQTPAAAETPKSEIEKQLEKSVPGPAVPPVEEADDLFK